VVTFTKDEIIPSTKISRNFGSILKKLKNSTLNKVAVIRNNEMEAIIVTYKDYEIMHELFELNEYKKLFTLIKERETIHKNKYISFDEVLKKSGIRSNDL